MKIVFSLLLGLFFIGQGQSQEIRYEIRGKYNSGISKEKLSSPKMIRDIRPGYPSSMIEEYTSTVILVNNKGRVRKASGRDEMLSAEQQNLLQTAEIGSDVTVNVGYVHVNAVTLMPEIRQMNFMLTVVPEVEASCPGGHQELRQYLENNAIGKITENFVKEMKGVTINFTVSKNGDIENAEISQSSSDAEIDKLLLKIITNMPEWKPALNAEGKRIAQEFQFSVGNFGC